MKYTYAAEVGTIPFRKASSQLMHAMGRLRWATEHVVSIAGDTYLKPNELLMLGYFEGMKIGVSNMTPCHSFEVQSSS
jgi:hypothetical protein